MENKFNFMETHEIPLRLEQYDDIFSDFDLRDYSQRALSVDFLEEIKRASRDKNVGGIELVLFAPEKERNETHESTIKERLAAHFRRHHDMLRKEKKGVLKLGISMVVLGIIFMVLAAYFVYRGASENLLFSFFVVFLEPAAWFLLWEGMDQVVFNSKNIDPELQFYKKMSDSHAHVHFKSY